MKKKISILWLLIGLLSLSFTSCGDDSFDDIIGSKKFVIDDSGRCVLKGVQLITKADIEKQLVGYGWQEVSAHEVKANGTLENKDYYEDMIGIGPTHIYFNSNNMLTTYGYADAIPAFYFREGNWSYDESQNFISRNGSYMQVLGFMKKNGDVYMDMVMAGGSNSEGTTYLMKRYKRMTEKELEEAKKDYTYDIAHGGVSEQARFRAKAWLGGMDAEEGIYKPFQNIHFALINKDGYTSSTDAYWEYFDSIVWKADGMGEYVVHRKEQGNTQSSFEWTTYFFKSGTINTHFYGYKGKHIVYTYDLELDLIPQDFLCYNWDETYPYSQEMTFSSLLVPKFDLKAYKPRKPADDKGDFHPFAQLFVIPKTSTKSNLPYVPKKWEIERSILTGLMDTYYGVHDEIKQEGNMMSVYRSMFKTLPENDIPIYYWQSKTTRVLLVITQKEKKDEESSEDNYQCYVLAEPINN